MGTVRQRTATPDVHACREVEDRSGEKGSGTCVKQAVLILADPLQLDLCCRHLPGQAGKLLRLSLSEIEALEAVDIHLFSSGTGEAVCLPRRQCHLQQGASFSEIIENAVDTLASFGYERIVIIGRDCPDLAASDIKAAFRILRDKRLVLGPDHRGGLYLIGLRGLDVSLLEGIVWQENSDCEQLSGRLSGDEIAYLAVKQDLDGWEDLLLLARSSWRWGKLATAILTRSIAWRFTKSTPCRLWRPRIEQLSWQLPPPAVTT